MYLYYDKLKVETYLIKIILQYYCTYHKLSNSFEYNNNNNNNNTTINIELNFHTNH